MSNDVVEPHILKEVMGQLSKLHVPKDESQTYQEALKLESVKEKVLQTLEPFGPEKGREILGKVESLFEERKVYVKGLLRKWGIHPDAKHPSDVEMGLMLYVIERLANEADPIKWEDEIGFQLKLRNLPKFFDFGVEWRKTGFARMSCGHKLAAALMMTTAPPDAIIESPWSAWSLYVPDGLLPMPFSKEGIDRLTKIVDDMAAKEDTTDETPVKNIDFDMRPQSGEDTYMMEIARIWCQGSEPLAIVVKGPSGSSVFTVPSFGMTVHKDSNVLIRNYVKGVCLTLSAEHVEKYRRGSWGPKTAKRRTGKEPAVGAQYELGSPVTIDLRHEVRRFVLESHGKKVPSPPKVQFLVRGHWRNQACGPGRVDHRHIWIEPFWKGPEDARVLLRPHVVRTDEDKKKGTGT